MFFEVVITDRIIETGDDRFFRTGLDIDLNNLNECTKIRDLCLCENNSDGVEATHVEDVVIYENDEEVYWEDLVNEEYGDIFDLSSLPTREQEGSEIC